MYNFERAEINRITEKINESKVENVNPINSLPEIIKILNKYMN